MNDVLEHDVFKQCEDLEGFDADHPLKKIQDIAHRSLVEGNQLHNGLTKAQFAPDPNVFVNNVLQRAIRAFIEIGKNIEHELTRHFEYERADMPKDITLSRSLEDLAYRLSIKQIAAAKDPAVVIDAVRNKLMTIAQRCAYGGEDVRSQGEPDEDPGDATAGS
jgi:hypothetical protein